MSECPRCGAPLVAGQEYCLECGGRIPGTGLGRPRDAGGGWVLRALLLVVVAFAGAAAAVAAAEGDDSGAEVMTATGGFVTLPEPTTLPAPDAGGPAGTEWPPGEDGWTIALASFPQTEGRKVALARARTARRRGLSSVGILDSSSYASLHPGYWVVFSGVYATEAEATSALQPARRFARTATVRHVVP